MEASRVEQDRLDWAKEILAHQQNSQKLLLPIDLKVAAKFAADSETAICSIDKIPEGWQALDIGPATIEQFYQGYC